MFWFMDEGDSTSVLLPGRLGVQFLGPSDAPHELMVYLREPGAKPKLGGRGLWGVQGDGEEPVSLGIRQPTKRKLSDWQVLMFLVGSEAATGLVARLCEALDDFARLGEACRQRWLVMDSLQAYAVVVVNLSAALGCPMAVDTALESMAARWALQGGDIIRRLRTTGRADAASELRRLQGQSLVEIGGLLRAMAVPETGV